MQLLHAPTRMYTRTRARAHLAGLVLVEYAHHGQLRADGLACVSGTECTCRAQSMGRQPQAMALHGTLLGRPARGIQLAGINARLSCHCMPPACLCASPEPVGAPSSTFSSVWKSVWKACSVEQRAEVEQRVGVE